MLFWEYYWCTIRYLCTCVHVGRYLCRLTHTLCTSLTTRQSNLRYSTILSSTCNMNHWWKYCTAQHTLGVVHELIGTEMTMQKWYRRDLGFSGLTSDSIDCPIIATYLLLVYQTVLNDPVLLLPDFYVLGRTSWPPSPEHSQSSGWGLFWWPAHGPCHRRRPRQRKDQACFLNCHLKITN